MKQRELTPSRYQLAPPHATTIPHELIPLLPANWSAEIPLARITTCGPNVSIAVLRQIHPGTETDGHPTLVYGPPDAALLEEKGASTALLLVAVLASQPHCSATKDWLSETLGHGNHDDDEDDLDGNPGLKRVDNVATQLRHLLFPPVLRDLPTANQLRRQLVISYRATRESGSGYRLAGLPLLWIDVEAIGEHLKQARALDQFGHDGLPAWQAAYEVAGRGIFLEREPYSDWASWRRQQVETQLWQCVQALWRPLAQQGEAGETEAVRILQSYWQSHITNEDVFRPLIELLGKRECYGQAEEYYAHLCLALEEEGKQPDHRTQETMMFLRALQIQRKPPQYQSLSQKRAIGESKDEQQYKALPVPSSHPTKTEETSRRIFNTQLLGSMIGTATVSFLDPDVWERLVVSFDQPLAFNRDSITAFQHCVEVCWEFCNCGKTSLAEQLLLTFLPAMQKLADHQKEAAQLVAEGLRLQSILSAHQLKMTEKLMQCLQSVKYARLACEPNTLASSLHELTAALRYTRQFDSLFLVFEEALSLSDHLMPPIRAGIYAGAAAAFAQRNRRKDADFHLHQSYEIFAGSTAYTTLAVADNTLSHLAEYEGIAYLEMGQFKKAYDVFERFTNSSPEIALPERNRLEMLNYQGRAALHLGDVEMYVNCLEKGIEGSIAIKSKKRLEEALDIFTQELPQSWLLEPRMKRVVERFQLPIRS